MKIKIFSFLKFIVRIQYILVIIVATVFVIKKIYYNDISMMNLLRISYNDVTKTHDSSYVLNDSNIFTKVKDVKAYNYRYFGSEIYSYKSDGSSLDVMVLSTECSNQFASEANISFEYLDEDMNLKKKKQFFYDEQQIKNKSNNGEYKNDELTLYDCECLENSAEYKSYIIDDGIESNGGVNISSSDSEAFEELRTSRNDSLRQLSYLNTTQNKISYVRTVIEIKLKDGSSFHEYRVFDLKNSVR